MTSDHTFSVAYPSVKVLTDYAAGQLKHLDSGRLDAELLLATALKRSRTWIHTWPEQRVTAEQTALYRLLIERRAAGLPLAYLTGTREFWSLSLQVSADTLIPRPETELLVELALRNIQPGNCVLDLGTGSGAIALALARSRPDATYVASDLSSLALKIAQRNADALNVCLDFVCSDWLCGFGDHSADIIVTNPPYVAHDDPHLDDDGVRHEPRLALCSGADGMDAIRQIVPEAARCLRRRGWLAIEHGAGQAKNVLNVLNSNSFCEISTVRDIFGNERVTHARCNMQ